LKARPFASEARLGLTSRTSGSSTLHLRVAGGEIALWDGVSGAIGFSVASGHKLGNQGTPGETPGGPTDKMSVLRAVRIDQPLFGSRLLVSELVQCITQNETSSKSM
jgi:hypothetical protein